MKKRPEKEDTVQGKKTLWKNNERVKRVGRDADAWNCIKNDNL